LKQLDLAIESDLANVTLLAVAVNRVCLELGLDSSQAGEIELCTAEAVTNAIRHAYHGKPGHVVAVRLSANRDNLLIEVSDSGSPMPLEHQQTLFKGPKASDSEPANPQALPEGGRGLHIIYELMDNVSYVSEQMRNRLIMGKSVAAAHIADPS
jgi:serine/threonine-protein kinase RsbW